MRTNQYKNIFSIFSPYSDIITAHVNLLVFDMEAGQYETKLKIFTMFFLYLNNPQELYALGQSANLKYYGGIYARAYYEAVHLSGSRTVTVTYGKV